MKQYGSEKSSIRINKTGHGTMTYRKLQLLFGQLEETEIVTNPEAPSSIQKCATLYLRAGDTGAVWLPIRTGLAGVIQHNGFGPISVETINDRMLYPIFFEITSRPMASLHNGLSVAFVRDFVANYIATFKNVVDSMRAHQEEYSSDIPMFMTLIIRQSFTFPLSLPYTGEIGFVLSSTIALVASKFPVEGALYGGSHYGFERPQEFREDPIVEVAPSPDIVELERLSTSIQRYISSLLEPVA